MPISSPTSPPTAGTSCENSLCCSIKARRWRKKHHPQSRQQVVVLHQGMRGLQCRLAELGREKEMLVRI